MARQTVPLYRPSDWGREKPVTPVPWRPEIRRDFGRLVHSSAFRRLQGKTQLFPGTESDFFRNRLTHSLEVAQVANSIGRKLNYSIPYFRQFPLDLDLLEFAGIAHDLGHPPFGHNGEKALDDCMKGSGGFEGNAQSLRILSRLEKKERREKAKGEDRRLGLNLCYRTLASILKYDEEIPSARPPGSDLVKGYYQSERGLVERIKRAVVGDERTPFKTVECQLMDVADDIAYSTFDLEDAFKAGFLSPLRIVQLAEDSDELTSRIVNELREKGLPATAAKVRKVLMDLFGQVIDRKAASAQEAVIGAYRRSGKLRDAHHRTDFTSRLVDHFMSGIRVKVDDKDPSQSKVFLEPSMLLTVEVVKRFTFETLIESPMLKFTEYRGYEIVRHIFETLAGQDGYKLLAYDVRQRYLGLHDDHERHRLVCDFVAGMTDRYAWEFYRRLTSDTQSIFKPIT